MVDGVSGHSGQIAHSIHALRKNENGPEIVTHQDQQNLENLVKARIRKVLIRIFHNHWLVKMII